jgi:hypothetical protein
LSKAIKGRDASPYKAVKTIIVETVKALGVSIKLNDVKHQMGTGYIHFWVEQKNGLDTSSAPLQLESGHVLFGGLEGDEGITYENMPRVVAAIWKRQITKLRRKPNPKKKRVPK